MNTLSRRQFLQMAAALTATLGWPASSHAAVQETLHEMASGQAPLLWLSGQACSGCSVSFLNAAYPDPLRVLTQYASLAYSQVISVATGDVAMRTIAERIAAGGYVLIVEGSVPLGMPFACRVGERDFTDILGEAARSAQAVVALGTCAAFGGIPAAPPNPTGAVDVKTFFTQAGISTPLINLPGCPAHPDWLLGTLIRVLRSGVPKLDESGRPEMIYGAVIHGHCPWFQSYERGHFAQAFGEPGCLFKLGCLGIRTNADCAVRRWNNKVSWCIEAGAPCIGCAQPEFVQQAGFPFYRLNELGASETS